MEAINERVIHIINSLGVTRREFANKLHVTPSAVTKFCKGEIALSDRTIADICRVFGISEAWLREGRGEMFAPLGRKERLAKTFGQFLGQNPDEVQTALFEIVCNFDDSDWEKVAKYAESIVEARKRQEAEDAKSK